MSLEEDVEAARAAARKQERELDRLREKGLVGLLLDSAGQRHVREALMHGEIDMRAAHRAALRVVRDQIHDSLTHRYLATVLLHLLED